MGAAVLAATLCLRALRRSVAEGPPAGFMDAARFSCHDSIKEASELAAKAAVAFFALLLLLHLTSELTRITLELLLGMLHLVTAPVTGAPLLLALLLDLQLALQPPLFLRAFGSESLTTPSGP